MHGLSNKEKGFHENETKGHIFEFGFGFDKRGADGSRGPDLYQRVFALAVYRNGGHIAIEILVESFPKKVQRIIAAAVNVLMVFILLFLMVQGGRLVGQMLNTGRATSYTKVPYALIYSAVPVGCFLMICNMLAELYQLWKGGSDEDTADRERGQDV